MNLKFLQESVEGQRHMSADRRLVYWEGLFGEDSIEAFALSELRMPEIASVYVAVNGWSTKIGFSGDPQKRNVGLNSGPSSTKMFWAVDMDKRDAFAVEQSLHRKLRQTKHHVRGEWYDLIPETAVALVEREIRLRNFRCRANPYYGVLRYLKGEPDEIH